MAFLKNSWYCAGWSSDLAEQPRGLKIIGEEVVLYRKKGQGEAVALSGICPHRFARLARGKVVGDHIECPYHGLQFNGDGQCAHNPHSSAIPRSARVKSYPLVERNGACWIWMGDPSLANADAIPAFDFVSDRKKWAGLTGYLRMESNYQLVLDNLLDLTHAAFIHVGTVGVKAEDWIGDSKMEHDFSVKDGVIHSDYIFRNSPPTPLFALFSGMKVGDIYSPMALYPASTLILDLKMVEPGQALADGAQMPSAHFIVPETETSCHYFYAISRNLKLEDDKITADMGELVRRAFVEEDAPIISEVQSVMGDAEFFSLRPVLLKGDIAAVQARRVLTQLIQKENTAGLKIGEFERARQAGEEVERVQ
jgi:phenylpropionate dioxygenase-like ring-hydroxylating dioxygenase large terminal subunit